MLSSRFAVVDGGKMADERVSDGSRLTLGLWMMLWTRKETGLPAFRMASTASSWLASLRSTPPTCQRDTRKSKVQLLVGGNPGNPAGGKLTSTMRSPVFRVPFCPAGLSSRMCLMKMPLITSPLFSLLPIPRPPTMLMPRDFPGSRKSSTLKGGTAVYTGGCAN